ncbi:MAG: hypothetical protein KDD51_09085, partial [Bdellovibrionales bacterium]|nr:hypothetical protein [Bdellovibrionales bacterium]
YEAQLRAEAAVRDQQRRNYEAQLRAEAAVRDQQRRNYEAQLRAEAAARSQYNSYGSSFPSYTSPSYSYPSHSYSYPSSSSVPRYSSPQYSSPQYAQPHYEEIETPPPTEIAQRPERSEPSTVRTEIQIRIPEGAALYVDGIKANGDRYITPPLEKGKQYNYVVEVEMVYGDGRYRKAFDLSFIAGKKVQATVKLEDVLRAKAEAGFGPAPATQDPDAKTPAIPSDAPAAEDDGWTPIPPGVVAIGGKRIQSGADAYKLNPDGSVTWRTPFAKNLREWEAGSSESLQNFASGAKKHLDDDERVDAAYFKSERELATKIGDSALEALAETVIAEEEKKRKDFRTKLREAQEALAKEQLASLILEAKSTAEEGPAKESEHLDRAKSLAERWAQSWVPFTEQWTAEKTRRADEYRPMVDAAEAARRYLDWETRSQAQDQTWFDGAKKKFISDTLAADDAFFGAETDRIAKLPSEEARKAATEALEKERAIRQEFRENLTARLTKDLEQRRAFTRSELLTVLGAYFHRKANFHESHKLRFAEETKRLETFDAETESQWNSEQKRQAEQYKTAQSLIDSLKPEDISLPDSCKGSPYALQDEKTGAYSLWYVTDEKRSLLAKLKAKAVQLQCKEKAVALLADAISIEKDLVRLADGLEWDPSTLNDEKSHSRFVLFQDGFLVFAWDASPLQALRIDWNSDTERFILRLQKDNQAYTDHMYEVREDGSEFKQVPWIEVN